MARSDGIAAVPRNRKLLPPLSFPQDLTNNIRVRVADPGSGAFLTSGSGIRDGRIIFP
jgi:hypothetical protein